MPKKSTRRKQSKAKRRNKRRYTMTPRRYAQNQDAQMTSQRYELEKRKQDAQMAPQRYALEQRNQYTQMTPGRPVYVEQQQPGGFGTAVGYGIGTGVGFGVAENVVDKIFEEF